MENREGREVNTHLACDQRILRTSVKYDREPSKSTWQADRQVQDFTSNEKNEPHAAQIGLHFSFWQVKWHLMTSGEGLADFALPEKSCVSDCKHWHKNDVNGKHFGDLFDLRVIQTDWIDWVAEKKICLVYGVFNCNCPAFCQNLRDLHQLLKTLP